MTLESPQALQITVIGAGIMGCALAYELSKAHQVTLIEAEHVAQSHGASTLPLALLNPHRGRSGRAHALDLAGLAHMHQLHHELAGLALPSGMHFMGVLRLASTSRQAAKWRKLSHVTWHQPNDIPSSYHAPHGGFLVPKGGWINPAVLLKSLVVAAMRRGARLLEQTTVNTFSQQAHTLTVQASAANTVSQTEGDVKVTADKVFICTGANAAMLTHLAAHLPKLTRTQGEMIALERQLALPYPLAGAVYGHSTCQRVWLGGNHRPADTFDADAPIHLRRAFSWFVPELANTPVSQVWSGARAKTPDAKPVVAHVMPNGYFVGALAGRGFLCGPYLASHIARNVASPTTLPRTLSLS